MLTYLELENFRAFSKRVRIEIRPITVLIGKNSTGKSSVLKFLQMLRQSVGASEGPFFQTEGRHVELGAWQDLKNKSESDTSYFKYEMGFTRPVPQIAYSLKILKKRASLGVSGGRNIAIEGQETLEYRVLGERSYFQEGIRGKIGIEISDGESQVYKREHATLGEHTFLNFPVGAQEGADTGRRLMEEYTFLKPARQFISELHHLGPVRQESQRMVQAASPPDGDVGHRGEHTLAHLVRLIGNIKSKRTLQLILKHVSGVLHVDQMSLKDAIPGLYARFEARNADTKAEHWLADFGFGVGQCLPIFVQGVLLGKGDVLTVEQPEAQLHPTAQLELGSFFADLWKERGVSSLIETHSGNILLRLRKLVRNGQLSPNDVSVAYFHVEDHATQVTNMGIKPDGELDGHLPMEFFGADIFEALDFHSLPDTEPE